MGMYVSIYKCLLLRKKRVFEQGHELTLTGEQPSIPTGGVHVKHCKHRQARQGDS